MSALTSTAAVKQYLGITGDADDARITALVARASDAIEAYCRRTFAAAEYTEYHDGRADARIVLRHRPVLSVASVHDDPSRAFQSATLLRSSDYVVRTESGILERVAAAFNPGQLNVKVVYTAGYAVVPEDVSQAAILLASILYTHGKQGAHGIASESHGDAYSVTYAQELMTPAVRNLLAPYREFRL